MKEWKPVPSVPGMWASSEGTVKAEPYMTTDRLGRIKYFGGRVWLGTLCSDGYYRLTYKQRHYGVHRLVCEAWHGSPPFEKAHAMHLDENPGNNKPENLKWGTAIENANTPKRKDKQMVVQMTTAAKYRGRQRWPPHITEEQKREFELKELAELRAYTLAAL